MTLNNGNSQTTTSPLDSDGAISADAGGTALSAPMAAALFSLANQALMRDGHGVIGYANPMLYWMGENCTDAFNDVTIGDTQANGKANLAISGSPLRLLDPRTPPRQQKCSFHQYQSTAAPTPFYIMYDT